LGLLALTKLRRMVFVQRNQLSNGTLRHRCHPALKTPFQLLGLRTAENTPKGAMGGDSIWKCEEGLEPLAFRIAKRFDLRPFVSTADDRTDRDDPDVAK